MRTVLVAAALAMGLSGCADSDFVEHPITSLIPSWGDEAKPAAPAQAASATETPAPASVAPQSPTAPSEGAPPAVQAAQLAPSAATNAHCRQLAGLRSRDAAYAGEDEETQDAVYSRTYAECTAWEARHRL